jgi:hypothetical protein
VIRKVKADLESAGKPASDGELQRSLDDLMVRAVDEIKAGR